WSRSCAAAAHLFGQDVDHGRGVGLVVVQRERYAEPGAAFGHCRRPDAADVEAASLKRRRQDHGALIVADDDRHDVGVARRYPTADLDLAIDERDELAQSLPTVRLLAQQHQYAAYDCRHKRRWRRSEDEGPAQVDEDVAKDGRA